MQCESLDDDQQMLLDIEQNIANLEKRIYLYFLYSFEKIKTQN